MILRPYQQNLSDELAKCLASGKRKVVAQLATGGGKTICFASISKRFTDKSGKSVVILVHRKELLQQTRRALSQNFGIDPQIIVAGMKYIPEAKVYVAMVETLKRRIDWVKNIGLVIIDEAHIANFNKIHEHFEDAFFIGFTATPLASGKDKPMKNYYEDIVCGIDIPDLIKMGNLAQNATYAAKDAVNRNALNVVGGEFDTGQMALEFSKPKYIKNAVKIYAEKANGTKAIVFNVNIEHSILVNQAFINAGYDSKHFDGTTPENEREAILAWFEITEGAILNNVGIATTGFDEPTIETVIVNRSTMSMPLWLQMTGRGSRPIKDKKVFTILDMGGNAITHGDWCQHRPWEDIFHNPPNKKGKEGVAPVKECPQCFKILHTRTMECDECGYIFPPPKPTVEEDLKEFVLVTKNLDVSEMISKNKDKKPYYTFFQIGFNLATQAKYNTSEMNQEKFNFILLTYFEKAEVWCRAKGIKFNKFHRELAEKTLTDNLKKSFKTWNP